MSEYDIAISLPSTAPIDLNASLTIKPNVLSYSMDNGLTFWNLTESLFIDNVSIPSDPKHPQIVFSMPSQIGSCDDLTLDAKLTTNLGGREAIFLWEIYETNTVYNGEYVTVSNENLTAFSDSVIMIGLTVTNWYGASSQRNVSVYKSSQSVVPNVQLNGLPVVPVLSAVRLRFLTLPGTALLH